MRSCAERRATAHPHDEAVRIEEQVLKVEGRASSRAQSAATTASTSGRSAAPTIDEAADLAPDVAEHECFENQRFSASLHSWGAEYPAHLQPSDPQPWTNRVHASGKKSIDEVACPAGWEWAGEWRVGDLPECDEAEGWLYGVDFAELRRLLLAHEVVSDARARSDGRAEARPCPLAPVGAAARRRVAAPAAATARELSDLPEAAARGALAPYARAPPGRRRPRRRVAQPAAPIPMGDALGAPPPAAAAEALRRGRRGRRGRRRGRLRRRRAPDHLVALL